MVFCLVGFDQSSSKVRPGEVRTVSSGKSFLSLVLDFLSSLVAVKGFRKSDVNFVFPSVLWSFVFI